MSAAPVADRPLLSVWDAASLIVGIVIGSSIYRTPQLIFGNVSSPALGMVLWFVGGVLSLCGALVYAELATTYPRCGGEYNYLTRAFGPWLGFLYAWAQLSVIQTGSIGALAYIAAESMAALFHWSEATHAWLAAASVIGLTAANMAGLRLGAGVQNLLTVSKLLGLAAVIFVGLWWGHADPWALAKPTSHASLSVALVLVLYGYGGWSDAAFVAAEVRDLKRNVPRALIGGLGLIVVVYLLVNLAYLRGLGGDGVPRSQQPAADVLALWLGDRGRSVMYLIVLITALGGVNGLVLAVSRVHATAGQDHRIFAWLGRFSRSESPLAALVLQAVVTVAIILTVGTSVGREAFNRIVVAVGLPAIEWESYFGGFDTLLAGSAPAFWLFFLLNAIAFFVLRIRDRHVERPFVAPGFPVLPGLFAAMCGWMMYSAAAYAWPLIPAVSAPLLLGVPLYAISWWAERASQKT